MAVSQTKVVLVEDRVVQVDNATVVFFERFAIGLFQVNALGLELDD